MNFPKTIVGIDVDGNAIIGKLDKVIKVKNDVDYPVYRYETFYHTLSDLCRGEFGDDLESIEKINE